MRWQPVLHSKPLIGEKRTIRRFLLFPKCIDGEYRWLEVAHIIQVYNDMVWLDDATNKYYGDWVDSKWDNL